MMTTRSQPRRKKVRQELVGIVPQAQLVFPFPTLRQLEASSAFPGGLAAEYDPSAGTAVGKGVCRLQVSFWWEQVEQDRSLPSCVLHGGTEQPLTLGCISCGSHVGSVRPEPGQAERGRGRTSAVTVATGKF